jgi:hypothetical protein
VLLEELWKVVGIVVLKAQEQEKKILQGALRGDLKITIILKEIQVD